MKQILFKYGLCLVPFAFFSTHGAVCAYRAIHQLPARGMPWMGSGALWGLARSAVWVGACISALLIFTVAFNDTWLWVERKVKAWRMRKLIEESANRSNGRRP